MLAFTYVVALAGLFTSLPLSSVAMSSMTPMNTSSHNNATLQASNAGSNWSDSSSAASGSASANQVAGTMVDGKCMCPAPVTCSSDKSTPTPGGAPDSNTDTPAITPGTNGNSTKGVPTGSMPNGTDPSTTPTGDNNNSTTSAASITDKSSLYTGLGLVAIASLVV